MKVVTRESALRPLKDEGLFCLSFVFGRAQGHAPTKYRTSRIKKSIDGTSNGSPTHAESGRLVESPYGRTVKKALKLREEIVHRTKVKLCRLTPVIGLGDGMKLLPYLRHFAPVRLWL